MSLLNKIRTFYQTNPDEGLTQDALARKCDTPYTTLTKIEVNVITKPSIQTVVKIAAGLDVTIDELLNSK